MNDSRIIELYFERSESAIDETAKAYGKLCYAVAYGVLSSHEDAEECVNDAYARVWNSIPPQKPRKLSAFLARITRNLALDVLAKKTADKRGGYLIAEELSDAIPVSSGEIADSLAIKAALEGFLRSRSARERKLFIGRYFYCQSIESLAEHYGEKAGNIKTLLFRMRQLLKQHLEKEGISF